MIGRSFSHYRVIERLGAGGMGEVYLARDEHLDRDVALKVLPPGTLGDEAARRRFRREAEALSRLNHAHIATVHDFDSSDGIDFLVMEYVPGQTLSTHLANSPLPEKEIATLAGEVAAALEQAHERGVVHRDLKPANWPRTSRRSRTTLGFSGRWRSPARSSTTQLRCSGKPTRGRSCRPSCGSHWQTCCARSASAINGPASTDPAGQSRGGCLH